jgi:N-methylhydantoinase B/oxoprolinase/acetone carboxylase alpha subunit
MTEFDPIELELFKNLFISISEEMGAVLERTSLSPNIKERRDFSCALFNQKGETFAQGSHIPVHLGAMPLSVQASLKNIEFKPGDLVVLNHPYRGGTHLPDITCITPVFFENRLAFFSANRAHHSDVGGMSPGSMPLASEIFQEGLIIPPVKLMRNDCLDRNVMDLILANVRTPEEREGDLLAQIAANYKGRSRLLEVIGKYGLEKISLYSQFIQDYTEKILRRTIKDIPDGCYRFHDYMDDDGISADPVRIETAVTIKGDTAAIDFTGSSPQVPGGINANSAVTFSAVLYVFRSLVEEDIPFNTGLMRPLKIHAPEGSVVNASFPAATAGGNVETSQRLVDVLLGALAGAIPERIPAASSGTMNNVTFGGKDPRTGKAFAYYETIGGGMGASSERDGLSGVHTHMTNSLNTPLEAMEIYLPLRINQYRLRKNSGGTGRYRGGEGIIREYQFLTPTQISIISERRSYAPYGAAGGENGQSGRNHLICKGEKRMLRSKVNIHAETGDILRIETPGGGGYGEKK